MGLVVGETFLYLAGLYLAALARIRLASRYLTMHKYSGQITSQFTNPVLYLVTTGELRHTRITHIRNKKPNKMPEIKGGWYY